MINAQLMSVFNPHQPNNHVYSTDRNHRIMGCNDWQARDVGLSCEAEAIGKCLIKRVYLTSDADLYAENNEDVLRTGIAKTCLEPETLEDGTVILYTSHKSPLKNEKGKVIGVLGMSVPINALAYLNNDLRSLSPQQLKCFQFLVKGSSLKQIALEMNLTYKTIEHYVAHIRKKLGCKNINELIIRAVSIVPHRVLTR